MRCGSRVGGLSRVPPGRCALAEGLARRAAAAASRGGQPGKTSLGVESAAGGIAPPTAEAGRTLTQAATSMPRTTLEKAQLSVVALLKRPRTPPAVTCRWLQCSFDSGRGGWSLKN